VGTPSIVSPHGSSPAISASSVVRSQSPGQPVLLDHTVLPESISRARGEELECLRIEVQNQRQTIALLVSEKMSLNESLERLSGVSASTSGYSQICGDSRQHCFDVRS
jgi:hypothetical protein